MKITTISLTPYSLFSSAKLNSWALKYLYLKGFEVTSLVYGHDPTYHIPEEVNGQNQYFFDFEINNEKHKIPIVPFMRDNNESIFIYETIERLEPDIIILIGDLSDFTFIKAVKSFYTQETKWLWIANNRNSPINRNNLENIDYLDGILCTNKLTYEELKPVFHQILEFEFCGCNNKNFYYKNFQPNSKPRIMVQGKNSQLDNFPAIIESVKEINKTIPVELYLHGNLSDNGDYDFNFLKEKYDKNKEFLFYPEQYISMIDGISDVELSNQYNKSDIYLSASMFSGCGLSVFESMSCGCLPILSNTSSYIDIADIVEKYLNINQLKRKDLIIDDTKLMTVGETYLSICNSSDIQLKLINALNFLNKYKGFKNQISEISKEYTQKGFLSKLLELINNSAKSQKKLCLE